MLSRLSRLSSRSVSPFFSRNVSRSFSAKKSNESELIVSVDGAGTSFDIDSRAVTHSMIEAADLMGIKITMEDVDDTLGLGKKEQCAAIIQLPHVLSQFIKNPRYRGVHHSRMVEEFYGFYRDRQCENLPRYSNPTPGFLEFYDYLTNERNIIITLNTMYSREETNIILNHLLKKWKVMFNFVVTRCDVERGRPFPDLLDKIRNEFAVSRTKILVFGDTRSDMRAAENGGYVAVGVVGKPETPVNLYEQEKRQLIAHGASFVIPYMTHAIPVVKEYEKILASHCDESQEQAHVLRR
jgi:beta-phosphoglucomutase-like phosphatase (HAD superfamily)